MNNTEPNTTKQKYEIVPILKEDYDTFANLVNTCISKNDPNVDIYLDFKKISFVFPYHLVILACIIERLFQKNIKVRCINLSTKLNRYLTNIGFLQLWDIGYNRDQYHNTKIHTALCLWHISESMVAFYADYAHKYFENLFFSGKDLDFLHINISEVCNNIFDHAESSIAGYIFTQYFPDRNIIILSICDFGYGIPNRVNQYRSSKKLSVLDDKDAIAEALKDGFSTKSSPRNMGLGLANVVNIVKGIGGTLKIVSNLGYYYLDGNTLEVKTFLLQKNFPGTLLWVELDTIKLEKREQDEAILSF
jgi:anti-sigma regulatory factor (Ser/Thr protein kinase)